MSEFSFKNEIISKETLSKKVNGIVSEIRIFANKNTIPDGWLLCNGQAINKADYPKLYERIGNKFGEDSTTFNLPNLNSKFLRGIDNNANRDPDKNNRKNQQNVIIGSVLGSFQDDQFLQHTHIINKTDGWIGGGDGHSYTGLSYPYDSTYYGVENTRPWNISVSFAIKF